MHPDETEVKTNLTHQEKNRSTRDIEHVPILPHTGKVQYLGQTITFHDQDQVEMQCRTK